MKLNDKYSIENEAHGFSLVEKTEIKVMKDGKETGKFKEGSKKLYYGTVYQALQGFLTVSVDDVVKQGYELRDIREKVFTTIECIHKTMDLIKDSFCIEVKTS